uniref:Galanin domain-containing protein n=1 Tax=Knipowitschia caucasica TaxID=637954 RepID=A0AAV2L286_KNICA
MELRKTSCCCPCCESGLHQCCVYSCLLLLCPESEAKEKRGWTLNSAGYLLGPQMGALDSLSSSVTSEELANPYSNSEANIRCAASCKCIGCRNHHADLVDKTSNTNVGGPPSVITPAMVEGVVVSLLARAEEAEREQRCEAWAQHMILNEFGRCFTEIGRAMFKQHKQPN